MSGYNSFLIDDDASVDTSSISKSKVVGDGTGSALKGAGFVLQGFGSYIKGQDQAEAENQNASYYREQAAFAAEAGQRRLDIFGNETKVLEGNQGSAFAKAGVSTGESSYFIAKTALLAQRESFAIRQETDMNVRLANLKADASEQAANNSKLGGELGAVTSGIMAAALI